MTTVCRAIGIPLSAASLALAATGVLGAWQRIDVPSEPFVDAAGVTRIPGCSGGPVRGAAGWVAGDTQFSFFLRPGADDRLIVLLDGGGACWNDTTCVGSALADNATYEAEVTEDVAGLETAPGIGDLSDPANPFHGFTQVFVPYCTGDIHWGSRDTVYSYAMADGSVAEWTIHHRGFDNLLAVTNWLEDYIATSGQDPGEVVVAGASAGGYGALIALAVIVEGLGAGADTSVLVDSANGVITESLHTDAFGGASLSGGAWGVETTAPDFLQPVLAGAYQVLPLGMFAALSRQYPDVRFGQYTRAWDGAQIYFYNVAKHPDDMSQWERPGALLESAVGWTWRARLLMALTAQLPTYRFYLGSGFGHTILADDEFYTEDSAEGVLFSQWVADMVDPPLSGDGDWRNVSCAPNCLGLGGLTAKALLEAAGKQANMQD
jgi:hypothetical protein